MSTVSFVAIEMGLWGIILVDNTIQPSLSPHASFEVKLPNENTNGAKLGQLTPY